MSATYSAQQVTKEVMELALIRMQRLSLVFQHVQECQHCQQIVKVGLSSRAALCGYLLWHAGVAEEGKVHEQQ